MPKKKLAETQSVTTRQPVGEEDEMSKDLSKYVTTSQAAEMLGVANDHVNRLLIAKKIQGQKLGHYWLVFVPSLAKYLTTKSKRGRPTSGEPTIQIEGKPTGQG
jgi:excisionase family DNA binding protein